MPPCWPTTQRPAGDGEAVLRFATAAAEQAPCSGPTGKLRASTPVSLMRVGVVPERRVDLLLRQSEACFTADQYDVGISALEEALAALPDHREPLERRRRLCVACRSSCGAPVGPPRQGLEHRKP